MSDASSQCWLRVRTVTQDESTVATGVVRSGELRIGHLVDVVFGWGRATVPVLGLVSGDGGVDRVGPEHGLVHVYLPSMERTRIGPGAVLATPDTVRATGTAEFVVQLLGELPLRVEIASFELRRRLSERGSTGSAGAALAVSDAALHAERARPDPDPDRFWARVLAGVASVAPASEDEVRAVRFDVNAIPTSMWLRRFGGQSLYLDFDGTVVRGRSFDRTTLTGPEHVGAAVRAVVNLTPPIVLSDEPLPVLGTQPTGWAEFRIGWAHVRRRMEVDPEAPTDRCPFVPMVDRPAFLAASGLSPGFVEVFVRGSFLSFDAGPLEDAAHADVDWGEWPALFEHRWCALTWWPGTSILVRQGAAGPVFGAFSESNGVVELDRTEEQVFRDTVVGGVLRDLEANGWFDTERESLLELGREDLVTADGSEPATPIRTRRLHLAERVQEAIGRLQLPYGDRVLDPAWAQDSS